MKTRTTTKMIVARFSDWGLEGPADVYYCRKEFARSAQIHGWGNDVAPNQIEEHMGDRVTLFDILYPNLRPTRVRYL